MSNQGGWHMGKNLEAELAKIGRLDIQELRQAWNEQLDESPPPCRSLDVLRRLLACKIQEQVLGGLTPDTRNRLQKLARTFEQNPDHALTSRLDLKPGTVLTRKWQGKSYRIKVLEDGFEHEGKRFASLSKIARSITGTRWSGPLFFGLRK